MKFKELQSMLLKDEYFITFQSMNSDKVYTKKCTLKETPNKVNQKDIDLLRSYDLSDKDISQIVQIIAYFNYINRVADGLGLEPEEFIDKKGYKNK